MTSHGTEKHKSTLAAPRGGQGVILQHYLHALTVVLLYLTY